MSRVLSSKTGILYSGKWMDRLASPKTLADLQELERIPTEDRGPKPKTTWSPTYVKKPSLLAYVDGDLEERTTREVDTCEFLRQHPHPNIATYDGCEETHGRVSWAMLQKDIHSRYLKRSIRSAWERKAFRSSGRELVKGKMKTSLERSSGRHHTSPFAWSCGITTLIPQTSCSTRMTRLFS